MRHTADVKALDDVSIEVRAGETLGIVGESGCGKSTLGRTLIRLYEPTSGSIEFNGKNFTQLSGSELRSARKQIQMIFQDPYASLNPRHTVANAIREPLDIHGVGTPKERDQTVIEIMKKVGLNTAFANRYPHEFSGGQRQRISIGRAIALGPRLVIADEPVSALDVSIQAQVLNLLKDLQDDLALSYIFISHDLGVIEHMSNRVAVMYLGKIVESGARETIFSNAKHPYTKALLGSVPTVGTGKRKKGRILTGDVPSPINPPSGCPFHPRCPEATSECSKLVPQLKPQQSNQEHLVACLLQE